jgi:NDP-sugar pyrophosphorylase family protein
VRPPALVLAAGLATRLRPLSLIRAKAALPVAGLPLASRVISWLTSQGISNVVVNLHHLPASLTRLLGDGQDLGARVRYSWEDPVLGSAGGPRHALPLLESSRFLIVNGDTLTDLDVEALLAAHERSGAQVTMALVPNPHPERYGGVLLDGDRIVGFTRRGETRVNFHFIGIQAVEAAVFEPLPDNVPAESVAGLYPRMLREDPGSVRAFVSNASFDDIGTPADYYSTSQTVAAREGKALPLVGAGASISPETCLSGSILWDDVDIAPGVRLTDCIVVDGVQVPAGTQLNRRILLPASAETVGIDGERRDNLVIASF